MINVYLYLCLALAVLLITAGAYEDLRYGPDPKFGYNYKNGLYWAIIIAICTPVLNLIVGAGLAWIHFPNKGRKWM